jgi:hypothetical protein
MGKALYNMTFYSASLSCSTRSFKSPSHAYYNALSGWRRCRACPVDRHPRKIGKYQRAELDQGPREGARQLYFLLGKFYYQRELPRGSVAVRHGAAEAEFYVRPSCSGAPRSRVQAKPAVESFKEVLRAA